MSRGRPATGQASDEAAGSSGSTGPRRLSGMVLGVAAIGNLLEWYDFGLYGLFAPVLAELFFPSHDRIGALIGVYGGFAIGFLMRPLGGAVFGHFGDRLGRRFVLIASIVMMGATTVTIGVLPTHATIGVAAPLLLLALRMVQGFSVGGEFTGSVAYLIETAPAEGRGLAGSAANIGSTAGMLLAAAIAALVVTFSTPAALHGFSWRIPFLIGGVIAGLGYFLRHRLREDLPRPRRNLQGLPLRQALARAPRTMAWATLFTAGYGIVNYLTMVFLPTYAAEFGRTGESRALQLNAAAQGLILFVVPLAGWLSDRAITRRSLLVVVFAAECAFGLIAFKLAQASTIGFAIAQISLGLLLALIMGSAPAMLAEQFESGYRLSAYSVCFNIGIGIAGGTAPILATSLIAATGSGTAAALYLVFAAAAAALAALMLADRSRADLD